MSECKYCGKKISELKWNKKFCCYMHMRRWNQLKTIKETFKLDDKELKIYKRVQNELLNSRKQKETN